MEKETYKNYDIIIEQDECGESPREWDNLGKMVCFHRSYTLGDEHDISSDNFDGWDEMEEYLKNECDAVVILPLFLYDHGNISMKTCVHGQHAGWDGGYVGFIYATRKQILNEYGCKKIGKNLRKRVEKLLLNEVEIYSNYLEGSIYCYRIELNEERIGYTVGGFYGYDNEENGLMENAKNDIDVYIKEKREEKTKKLKAFIKNGVELSYR